MFREAIVVEEQGRLRGGQDVDLRARAGSGKRSRFRQSLQSRQSLNLHTCFVGQLQARTHPVGRGGLPMRRDKQDGFRAAIA